MPRQPFLAFFEKKRGGLFEIGADVLGKRPELELLIAKCLMAWPMAEAEMATLLAQLLGVSKTNEAVLAVYQSLRRSTAQYAAISEAANIVITEPKDRELLDLILNVHKSIEAERNALTHGHFGTYSLLPDGIIWMNNKTYVDTRTQAELIDPSLGRDFIERMYSSVSIYKARDFEMIFTDIKNLGYYWHNFSRLLRLEDSTPHAELYRQICEEFRICLTQLCKPVPRPFGLETQPFVLPKSWKDFVVKKLLQLSPDRRR